MRADILGSFKRYDESIFKHNLHKVLLEAAHDSLLPTERILLQSNRIERKTILLNQMQMFDQVHQEEAEVRTMERKHKDLLEKIGSDGINRMLYEYYYNKNQETLLGDDSTLVPDVSMTGVATSTVTGVAAQTSYRTSQKHHLVVTGNDSQVLKPPNDFYVYVDNQEKKEFL